MSAVEDIQQAVSRLSPEELAKFRAWFKEFDAVRTQSTTIDIESVATKLGRFAGRTLAEFRKRPPPKS